MEAQEPEAPLAKHCAALIGEVNVQFPDTLLWKRRYVEIDAVGDLVLSQNSDGRASSKRYHFSEFYTPYIPDRDREELPNSEYELP